MSGGFLFTTESVTEGHPDKIADQVSDGVLDAVLRDDPYGRVACETLVTTGLIVVAGEISTSTFVDIPLVARETVRGIGYDDAAFGFDCDTCAVISTIDRQSPDIAQGVSHAFEERAAGSGDEERLYGLMEIAERQQAAVQAALDGLAAERAALAREREALAPGVRDVKISAQGAVR